MPSPFFDFADTKDIGPLITLDDQRLVFACGGSGLDGVLFRWQTSDDSGATWSAVHFPLIFGSRGPYFPQPISNLFRGPDGTMYMPMDGVAGTSLLWASKDNGHTWSDTGGRTGGRHTLFVALKDGSILGLGGKSSGIDGYMPQSVSRDGGKSWVITKTVFPAVGENQQRAQSSPRSPGSFYVILKHRRAPTIVEETVPISRRDFIASGAAVAALGRRTGAVHLPTAPPEPLVVDCQSHLYFPEILARMEKRTEDPVVFTKDGERWVRMGPWLRRVLPKHMDVQAKLWFRTSSVREACMIDGPREALSR